ncbi:activator of Hsp90 ATPase [Irpex lacteus]|nr:activator of Hsp90 ATPase [Irpex lacteus]
MAAVPAPMAPTTANWHWKNKNVTPWAKQWFERELTSLSIKEDSGEEVSITEVTEVDGDVELGQRKSKLLTIYDCRVVLKWSGKTAEGEDVAGRLTIPEVSHEITLDGLSEYVWEWSLTTDRNAAVEKVYALAKSKLPVALEAKLSEFPSAIINTHGKDLTVSADPSRSGTPAPAAAVPAASSSSTASAAAAAPKPAVKKPAKNVNTASITVDAGFMASADDLFSILTDEKRIPQWTRAPAQSAAKPDTEYSLFGGGVKGKYVSLTPGKEIVQTWALSNPSWPSGHFATLTTTFEQSSDSTKVIWKLDGVPLGQEDELTRNIQGYYVHGLKSIGLGSEL